MRNKGCRSPQKLKDSGIFRPVSICSSVRFKATLSSRPVAQPSTTFGLPSALKYCTKTQLWGSIASSGHFRGSGVILRRSRAAHNSTVSSSTQQRFRPTEAAKTSTPIRVPGSSFKRWHLRLAGRLDGPYKE